MREIDVTVTMNQAMGVASGVANEHPALYAQAFEQLQEFRRTQPALYDAICAYAQAYKLGKVDEAFERAGDVAAIVLALAAGLPVGS